jgi:Fuc2NAc and GlcNAc transferase
MMARELPLVALAAFLIPFALTPIANTLLKGWHFWDVPGARSSHTVPLTRGSGILIWVGMACAAVTLLAQRGTDLGRTRSYLIGSAAVAAIGLVDDARHLRVLPRLFVHLGAAALVVSAISDTDLHGVWSPLALTPFHTRVVSVIWIAWLTNVWNFMDGSDGLAASQGVVAGMFGVVIAFVSNRADLAVMSAGLAAACAGFLFHNWHPADVFMGDAGSGAVGFAVGVLSLDGRVGVGSHVSVLLWVAPLALFLVDATATVARRVVVAKRVASAHRSHFYQLAIRSGLSHAQLASAEAVLSTVLAATAVLSARSDWLSPLEVAIAATGFALMCALAVSVIALRREGVGILLE